jgi:hypothetical protein
MTRAQLGTLNSMAAVGSWFSARECGSRTTFDKLILNRGAQRNRSRFSAAAMAKLKSTKTKLASRVQGTPWDGLVPFLLRRGRNPFVYRPASDYGLRRLASFR